MRWTPLISQCSNCQACSQQNLTLQILEERSSFLRTCDCCSWGWHRESKQAEEPTFMHFHLQFIQHYWRNLYFIWRGCNSTLANVTLTLLQLPKLWWALLLIWERNGWLWEKSNTSLQNDTSDSPGARYGAVHTAAQALGAAPASPVELHQGEFGSSFSERSHIPLGQLPPYMTHTTSLSWICCFWNENTLLAFPSRSLVIITKHLSTRRPSFPESLDLITSGNVLLFLQTLRYVGFWAALLLQSQTLLWLVEGRGGKSAGKSQKANCSDYSQRCCGFTLHH